MNGREAHLNFASVFRVELFLKGSSADSFEEEAADSSGDGQARNVTEQSDAQVKTSSIPRKPPIRWKLGRRLYFVIIAGSIPQTRRRGVVRNWMQTDGELQAIGHDRWPRKKHHPSNRLVRIGVE